jgi:hypothetical protein
MFELHLEDQDEVEDVRNDFLVQLELDRSELLSDRLGESRVLPLDSIRHFPVLEESALEHKLGLETDSGYQFLIQRFVLSVNAEVLLLCNSRSGPLC